LPTAGAPTTTSPTWPTSARSRNSWPTTEHRWRGRERPCASTAATSSTASPLRSRADHAGSVLVLGPLVARMGQARVSFPAAAPLGPARQPPPQGPRGHGGRNRAEGRLRGGEGQTASGAKIYFDISTSGHGERHDGCGPGEGDHAPGECRQGARGGQPRRDPHCHGAKIKGAGTDVITIEGVDSLRPCEVNVIPDRIEAGPS